MNNLNNKLINTIVNCALLALLLTNGWVLVFNKLLNFLNQKFPALPATNFIISGASPEPFEIPLYLVLSVVFILIIYLIYINNQYLSKIGGRVHIFIKLVACFGLLAIFVRSLGDYPMKNEIYLYAQPIDHGIVNLVFSFYILMIIFVALQLTILQSVFKKNRQKFNISVYVFLILLIAVLIFEPRFPISWHDYSYFLGPILEISHGQTIYTQIQSQYGFLSVMILAFLYKLHLLNLSWLPVLVWLAFIAQYFLSFYLIYAFSQSLFLGILGLFSIMNLNVFSSSACCLTIGFIQGGAFRWLPITLLVFFLYKFKKIDSGWFILILSLLSLWMIDVGIAILMAYSFTLLIMALVKIIDLKRLIRDYSLLGLSLIGVFVLINLINLTSGYQFINISLAFTKIQEYSRAGFGMIPMTEKSYFWLIILIYFSSLLYFFQKKNHTIVDQALLFSANLTLFASVYFVGRSHPLNLFTLAPISVLTLFIGWSLVLSKIKSQSLRNIFFVIIFIFFVFLPIYFRRDSAVINVRTNLGYLKQGNIFQPEMDRLLKERYHDEIKLINKNLREKNVLIISSDDTYLLYLTNKASLLNINPLTAIISKSDIDFSLKKVLQICPRKIVVDCNAIGKCPFVWKLNYLIYPYQIILNRINQQCHLQYQPKLCTNQLCLMEAN